MEYSGLIRPYKVNRPIKDDERQRQLHQKQRLEVEPAYQMSVIRFNSTYMELVDKWFAWRGFLTTVATVVLVSAIFIAGMFPYGYFTGDHVEEGFWWAAAIMFIISLPLFALCIWGLKTDAFRFTHFPIRLNRKTRMVHVFRTNGTVLSVPWDEVFFCIASLPERNWEIQEHVLDKDGVTVKETFALFPEVSGSKSESEANLPRCWEFVRRYMEDGPASVADLVEYCLPIADQREPFAFGFHRTHSWVGGVSLPLMIWILLIYLVTYPGRWLALRTSKIPQWPQEIEAVCAVDANDPFRKDASTNKPITDNSPIYWVAAIGVALLVAWVW
jgi:hypothetical protein